MGEYVFMLNKIQPIAFPGRLEGVSHLRVHLGDNVPSVKRRNRALILELILRQGPIPRVTLSEITGLSRAAVSTITGELIDADIIEEKGENPDCKRNVGRAPVMLDINSRLGGVLAIDIDNEGVHGAFVNLKSDLEQETDIDIADMSDPDHVLQIVNNTICLLLAGAQLQGRRVLGIGISLPGLTDPLSGIVRSSTTLGWRNYNLVEKLQIHSGLPIVIDSNVRSMVLAEHLFGVGRSVSNMALIYLGAGIGCGIILNDEIYAGSANRAGEIGHATIIGAGDKVCSCGNKGCLETVASGKAMLSWVSEELGAGRTSTLHELIHGDFQRLSIDMVVAAANNGDALAKGAIGHVSQYLGLAIASLVNWYDPRLIVLAGSITEVGEILLNTIVQVVEERSLGGSIPPQITISRFGRRTGLVGAGALALHELVYSPRFDLPGEMRLEGGSDHMPPQRLLRLTINRG